MILKPYTLWYIFYIKQWPICSLCSTSSMELCGTWQIAEEAANTGQIGQEAQSTAADGAGNTGQEAERRATDWAGEGNWSGTWGG